MKPSGRRASWTVALIVMFQPIEAAAVELGRTEPLRAQIVGGAQERFRKASLGAIVHHKYWLATERLKLKQFDNYG
jgi:hypothetical protein